MNKFIILITGIPGTGKITFAKYLSERIHIPMVSKDLVKEKLFDKIGVKNRREKVTLGIAAQTVMYYFADSSLYIAMQRGIDTLYFLYHTNFFAGFMHIYDNLGKYNQYQRCWLDKEKKLCESRYCLWI